ncbi:MAG: hypothetical protein H7Y03_15405 [Chitinophagaceae bacterium]|nr:hypothetical protein [Chitinophagaceae bacterium]
MSQDHVFGKNGWATIMFPSVRNNLYLLFDDGWEVRLDSSRTGNDRWLMGTMTLAEDKFPDCKGEPAERLRKLNQLCINAGWRGAALWIPAQASGEKDKYSELDRVSLYKYFKERFKWCKIAGIEYLKVDWGYRMKDEKFRFMLTNLAREIYPSLKVEHAGGTPPLNDYGCPWCSENFRHTGKFRNCEMGKTLSTAKKIIPVSSFFRTYDTSEPFNTSTTLDRIAEILKYYSGKKDVMTILNCEYAAYTGASLGCAIGLMSVPPTVPLRSTQKSNYDEAVRAINWFKIAPAFGIGYGRNFVDTVILTDSHVFKPGDSWIYWLHGQRVNQSAPAIISRNMPLPKVSCTSDTPFVMASRNPNGAIAIATQERRTIEKGLHFPLAEVYIEAGNGKHPVGIFGRYKRLLLHFTKTINGRKILAQDLAGNKAIDITEMVEIKDSLLILTGDLINKIGLSAASLNDLSTPGMVLVVK